MVGGVDAHPGGSRARCLTRAVRGRVELVREITKEWDDDMQLILCGLCTGSLDSFLAAYDICINTSIMA